MKHAALLPRYENKPKDKNKMHNKYILRTVCVLLAMMLLCLHFPIMPTSALEVPQPERIGAAYLYNLENEQIMFEYNAKQQMFPAASVKVMTAVVAYEALRDRMDTTIDITDTMIRGVSGNNIAIEAGERILVRDLLYALLLKGANDAAYVLAHYSHGSPAAFVEKMNEKAAALGMKNTVYTNPTGMHDDLMVTTAEDQFLCARAFCSYEELVTMSSISKHVIEATDHCVTRNLYNRNAFVSKLNSMGTIKYYYEGAKGINFGSTTEGGDSFVTMASRNGLTYICVILGGEESEDEEDIYAFYAAKALLDYALDGFGYVEVLSTKRLVYDMPVSLCEETDHVMLVPAGSIKSFLPVDTDLESELTYSYTVNCDSLTAPVEEGHQVGYISVYYKDTLLGTQPLVTQSAVKLSTFLSTLEGIKTFTQSKFFICTAIALVVVSVGFVLTKSYLRAKKSKKSRTVRFR